MQKLNSGALNRILLFVYILSLSTNAIAQNKNNSKETYLLPPHGNYVYGRVIEKLSKEPMVGVTIRLDGHSTGVITDINGCYVLTLPEKGGLVIYSYIGFETRKIKVTSRQKVDVQMVEATESIQEVIVTGYNSIQKESFTGNTTKIEKEDLLKVNPNNLISAIQTFDPSFRIQENLAAGSDPNSLPQFVLRGQTGIGETTLGQTSTSSISREVLSGNSNLPIFILDGFEVDVEKIYDLDMNSIHSINILKDAAATAMYGSRAANGVIVIERRAPEAGKFRVQYSGVLSAELPDLSSYNLMNAREKLETERLAEALAISHAEAAEQCVLLQQRLAESDLPLELRRLENSWQLCTIAGYDTVIRTALELRSNTPLSNAAMEVLAVVAYNQPVTRSFIEQVRGVDSSSVVASLEEKGLIEEAGRMELPGRPVAFRTTAAFLRCFGLSDLSELPELQPPEETEETEEEEQLGFDDLTTPEEAK